MEAWVPIVMEIEFNGDVRLGLVLFDIVMDSHRVFHDGVGSVRDAHKERLR